MPQMFKYCGQRVQVYKRAHKTCDTIAGPVDGLHWTQDPRWGPSRVPLRWKSLRWLSGRLPALLEGGVARALEDGARPIAGDRVFAGHAAADAKRLHRRRRRAGNARKRTERELRYACQATELHGFSTPIKWWDARQYVEDYRSGNTSIVHDAAYARLRDVLLTGAWQSKSSGPARSLVATRTA